MPADIILNDQVAVLAATIMATDTVIPLGSILGPGGTSQFRVVVDSEIMIVTGGSGTASLTVVRGAEGTPAVTHGIGTSVTVSATAGGLNNAYALSATGGATAIDTSTTAQTKSGALTVPVRDKGGAVYNVKAYGAAGDGVTDDTAAIQAAINAAIANYGRVMIPPAIYMVTNLTVPAVSRISIQGGGSPGTILRAIAGSMGVLLNVNPAAVVGIDLGGLTMDCAAAPSMQPLVINNTNSSKVADIQTLYGAIGVDISNSGALTMDKCGIANATTAGVRFNGEGGMECSFDHIVITRNVAGTTADGFLFTRSTATDVGGLYLHDVRVTTGGGGVCTNGFRATSPAANTAAPIWAIKCIFDTCSGNPLVLNNMALGNWVACWFTGITTGNVYAIKITGGAPNYFTGCLVAGSGTGGGFDLSGGTVNLSVLGCYINNGTYAFNVNAANPPTGIKIAENLVGATNLTNDYATLMSVGGTTDFVQAPTFWTHSSSGGGVIKFQNSDGAGRLAKFLRVGTAGDLRILNNAFNSNVMVLDDAGNVSFPGYASATTAYLNNIQKNGGAGLGSVTLNEIGGAPAIGFQGAAAIVSPAQTVDLKQAMVNYGLISSTPGATPLNLNGGGLTAGHVAATGTAPTVAAGAGNGTTPPAPTATGNDTRGALGFGSGTAPAAGAQVVVTFATAYAAAPVVTLTPGNAATQPLGLYVSAVATTGFTLSSASAPTAAQAAGTYSAAYQVIG